MAARTSSSKPAKHRAGVPGRPANHASKPAPKKRQTSKPAVGKREQLQDLEPALVALRNRYNTLHETAAANRESNSNYSELFDRAPIGYAVHDKFGFISQLNKTGETLLNLKPGYGGCFIQFFRGNHLAAWLEHLHRCARHSRASSELMFRVGKRVVPMLVVTVEIRTGSGDKEYWTVLVNIEEQQAAHTRVSQTLTDYHRLIDSIEGIIWEAEADSLQVLFVTGYAEKLLGYSLEDWKRPEFWLNRIYVDDRDRVSNELAKAVKAGRQVVLEYRTMTADRCLVWLHDSVTPVERDGRLRLLGLAIDVTERHRIDEELRKAHDLLEDRVAQRTAELRDKVADLEAFSYTLSHDMRSPIRAMEGYATLLERTLADKVSDKERDFLQRIRKGALRLDLLVRDVLNYSRVARAPLDLEPVPLGRVVHEIVNDYPELSAGETRLEIQEPLPSVYGHEAFIGQAMTNLLNNAVKFVAKGRPAKVRVWAEEAPPNHKGGAKALSNEEWVRICVEDNGVGIAPQDQRRIFRIFERIHSFDDYEGTGIGLAIVQKAVERMGGRLGVDSKPGEGSRFWIELKRAEAR